MRKGPTDRRICRAPREERGSRDGASETGRPWPEDKDDDLRRSQKSRKCRERPRAVNRSASGAGAGEAVNSFLRGTPNLFWLLLGRQVRRRRRAPSARRRGRAGCRGPGRPRPSPPAPSGASTSYGPSRVPDGIVIRSSETASSEYGVRLMPAMGRCELDAPTGLEPRESAFTGLQERHTSKSALVRTLVLTRAVGWSAH